MQTYVGSRDACGKVDMQRQSGFEVFLRIARVFSKDCDLSGLAERLLLLHRGAEFCMADMPGMRPFSLDHPLLNLKAQRHCSYLEY